MRRTRRVGAILGVAVVGAVLVAAPVEADVIGLEPILGPGGETPHVIPESVNDGGYVLGRSFFGGESAWAWSADVGVVVGEDLDVPPGVPERPVFDAIDEDGTVAGHLTSLVEPGHPPFVADLHDGVVVLLDDGGFENALMTDIVAGGAIVGSVYDGAPLVVNSRAAAWVGPTRDLLVLDDLGHGSFATDVNPSGTAVGWMVDDLGRVHPATWDLAGGGTLTDLAPITGYQVMTGLDVQVNDLGDVLVPLGVESTGSSSSWGHDVVVEHSTGRVVEPYAPGTGGGAILNDEGEVASLIAALPGEPGPHFEIFDVAAGTHVDVPAPGNFLFRFNDRGQIATTRPSSSGSPTGAVVWDPVRDWIDLGDGGGRGVVTWAMSSDGLVAGVFVDAQSPWIGTVQLGPEPPRDPAALVDGSTISVSWSPPVSPGDAPIDEYRVLRDGSVVADVGGSTTSFADPVTADTGVGSTYTIVAVNAFGESLPSEPAIAVAVPAPPVPSGGAPAAVAVVVEPSLTG